LLAARRDRSLASCASGADVAGNTADNRASGSTASSSSQCQAADWPYWAAIHRSHARQNLVSATISKPQAGDAGRSNRLGGRTTRSPARKREGGAAHTASVCRTH